MHFYTVHCALVRLRLHWFSVVDSSRRRSRATTYAHTCSRHNIVCEFDASHHCVCFVFALFCYCAKTVACQNCTEGMVICNMRKNEAISSRFANRYLHVLYILFRIVMHQFRWFCSVHCILLQWLPTNENYRPIKPTVATATLILTKKKRK